MTITGGQASKIGNWYEEAALLPWLLRMLAGREIGWVHWEHAGDGDGIDFSVAQSGRMIGVQCKHRSNGRMSLSDLRRGGDARSVLGYAKAWLARDVVCVYELHTDAPCPEMQACCEAASRNTDVVAWAAEHQTTITQLIDAWGGGPQQAKDRCQRMRFIVCNQLDMERQIEDLARGLTGHDQGADAAYALIHAVGAYARGQLGRRMHRAGLRTWLRGRLDPGSAIFARDGLAVRIERSLADFIDDVGGVRGPVRLRERPAAAQIREHVQRHADVLVHGDPGSGKSEVLAACARAWRDAGACVVVLRADAVDLAWNREDARGLLAYTAGEPILLIIDQFDALTWGGVASHPSSEAIHRLIQDLRRPRGSATQVRFIIGCRTLDAAQDTQLQRVLASGDAGGPAMARVHVAPWEPKDVEAALAEAGIAAADLEPRMRDFVRTPVRLRLLLEMGAGAGVQSGMEFMGRYWEWAKMRWGQHAAAADATLTAIAQRMHDEGLMQVDAELFRSDPGLPVLIASRVLAQRGRSIVASHQILLDDWLARHWGRQARDAGSLRALLGERQAQTLLTASVLRLAAPHLCWQQRTRKGLLAVMGGDDLRPIVLVGGLRGMASTEPEADALDAAIWWLEDPRRSQLVMAHLLRGNLPWMQALAERGSLDALWTQRPELRPVLAELVASVAQGWGDGAAALIRRWSDGDPAVLDRIAHVFWHEPSLDTDDLFEQRVRAEARGATARFPVDWAALLAKAPLRAVRLLAVRLPQSAVEREDDAVPGRSDPSLVAAGRALGSAAWDALGAWWRGLPEEQQERSAVRGQDTEPLPLRIGELIAIAWAAAIDRDERTWDDAVAALPTPMRIIDRWLLLRCGARIGSQSGAQAALRWFMADPGLATTRLGYGERHWAWSGDFVERITRQVLAVDVRMLERWIMAYRDAWTIDQEHRRYQRMMVDGIAQPSRSGASAYHLLPRLPSLSPEAATYLDVLRRKFDHLPSLFWQGARRGRTYSPHSPIPYACARRWQAEEWEGQFARAALHPSPPWSRDRGRFDISTLSAQLQDVASRSPKRCMHIAARAEWFPVPARQALLRGLTAMMPPDHPEPGDPAWEPLCDDDLIAVVDRPAFLAAPACRSEIARIVEQRPRIMWPRSVLDALMGVAMKPIQVQEALDTEDRIQSHVLNDPACSALAALVAAAHQPAWQDAALLTLQAWVTGDRAHRAAAAWALRAIDRSSPSQLAAATDELLVAAAEDPAVAAMHDTLRWLLRLVAPPSESPLRTRAADRILAIRHGEDAWIRQRFGEVSLELHRLGVLDDAGVEAVATGDVSMRRGVATAVGSRLVAELLHPAAERCFLRVADDEDAQVRAIIDGHLAHVPVERWTQRPAFLAASLRTRAVRDGKGLLYACDRAAELHLMRALLPGVVAAIAASQADVWTRYHQEREAAGLVSRWAEEAARRRDQEMLAAALDAWDRLLMHGVGCGGERLVETLVGPVSG